LSKPLSSLITFVKTPSLKIIISFIIVFVLIIFFGAIINYIAGKMVRKTPFSLPDRVLGMGFGFIRGLAIVTLIVLLLKLTPFPKDDWWKNSFSMRQFDGMATWVKNQFPEAVAKQFD
jgi:membrane protein required for colicin V production